MDTKTAELLSLTQAALNDFETQYRWRLRLVGHCASPSYAAMAAMHGYLERICALWVGLASFALLR